MFRALSQVNQLRQSITREIKSLEAHKARLLAKTASHCPRQQALEMACLAKLAYQQNLALIWNILSSRQAPFQRQYQTVEALIVKSLPENKSTSCGLFATTLNEVIIVLRGTKEKEDFLFDSLCLKNDEEIHLGFELYAERIWEHLRKFIAQHKHKPIILIGHSLGGAVATLIGYKLNQILVDSKILKNSELFSFGAPCFGTNKLKLDTPIWRFRTAGDLIPYLPPKFWQYDHSDLEYLLDNNYQLYQLDNSIESNRLKWYELLKIVSSKIEFRSFSLATNLLQYHSLASLLTTGNFKIIKPLLLLLKDEHSIDRYIEILSEGKVTLSF